MKVLQRFWYVQHMGSMFFFLNPPEAPKVATLVRFFNVEKTEACFPHQDFEMQFFSTLFNKYVYRRVSISVVDIFISKEEEIFGPKILMMETIIPFLAALSSS